MRLKILAFLLSFSFILSPAYAYAESTSTTTSVTTTPTTSLHGLEIKNYNDRKELRADYMAKTKALREDYQAKIKNIKDERKKTLVEKIAGSLTNTNKRRTTEMSENLTKMNSILERISSKAATLKGEGKNTTTLDTSISTARTAIATAQDAVTAQAAKEYVISITSETTLRTDINPVVTQFKTDIQATYAKVIAARKAVYDAAIQLRTLLKPSITITSTP